MSSPDFVAAQARLHARRQKYEAAERARHAAEHEIRAAALAHIPSPLSRLSSAGLSVWDAIRGREGTRPAFRVGQVDAELLDEELVELLKGQVSEGLKYWGSHLTNDYAPEILLALRAILFKLTIWDHNASYGAALQGLRYTDGRAPYPSKLSRPPPKRWQKAVYGAVTVIGRYGWTKWETYLLSLETDFRTPSPLISRLSKLTDTFNLTHDIAAFASFLVFLLNGRYRTVLDRLLRLRLVPSSSHSSREVSFEYLNRQLVWHAFTEFLLFLLPLVGVARWRRILSRAWRTLKSRSRKATANIKAAIWPDANALASAHNDDDEDQIVKGQGELSFLPERTCAICYQDQSTPSATGEASEANVLASNSGGIVGSAATDITNPYEAIPCGCIYCFACLAQRISAEEGGGWTCLRCAETVMECKPWNGDVLEETPVRTVSEDSQGASGGKSVGFVDEGIGEEADEGEESFVKGGEGENGDEETMRRVDPMPIESDVEGVAGLTPPIRRRVVKTGEEGLYDSIESSAWRLSSVMGDMTEEEEEDQVPSGRF